MRHLAEEDLIAYQLGESADAEAIRHHLETCSACSVVSESIAETLRVFSWQAIPEPDLEQAWTRLRGNLTVLEAAAPRRSNWRPWLLWPALGSALAALLLTVFLGVLPHHGRTRPPVSVQGLAVRTPGPLSAEPADPAVAAHLESAERLLTAVNHEQGPLDTGTREQARTLLLKNAVYVQTAHARGDVAEASVLEDLGRVLTSLEHEPEKPKSTWRLRLEMNTDGLLLDIRILRQNDEQKQ